MVAPLTRRSMFGLQPRLPARSALEPSPLTRHIGATKGRPDPSIGAIWKTISTLARSERSNRQSI